MDIITIFKQKDVEERIDFFQFDFFKVIGKSSDKDLNVLFSTVISDDKENKYVQKLAIERLMDLIFFNKLKPRQALSILIDNWETGDVILNSTRIKSLYYLFEHEKSDIQEIFQQYLYSHERELNAEAYFHLGLISLQEGILAHNKIVCINILEKSKRQFMKSCESVENRADAEILYKIVDLTINILNNITHSLKKGLKEIGEILFKIESFAFNFKTGPFYVGFYRILVALAKISDKSPRSWLDYRLELSSLFEQYAIVKNQEIKSRLSLSKLSANFIERLDSAFFEPFFALNFSAEQSRIEIRVSELPEDSQEKSFLENLLKLLADDPKKKAFSESLRNQLMQIFPLVSEVTITALEEKYKGDEEGSRLFKMYRELSKPTATQLGDAILKSCLIMQTNRIYYGNYSEDDRNTFIASMLTSVGFRVKDQTRKSTTETGKSAGEVDIFIEDIDGYPISIIEALNLSSVDKAYIKTHIDKIFIYDANGLSDNYVLVYANIKDFGSFYNRYRVFVESHSFKYPLIDLVEDNSIEFADLKKFTVVHNRSDTNVNMHHIVLNLSNKMG